jgi:hypothetical protein
MSETEFAKKHLREHLGNVLVAPISEGFWSILKSSVEVCERNGQQSEVLRTFQNMLTRIPEWSEPTLNTEVERIQKVTKCNYLDDLIMGVFIAYLKSFASLHYHGPASELKIDFERPSLSKFVHELYKHSARKVWQVAYLFKTHGTTSEQQARNRQDIERLISECMEQVIHSFLPWESITKKYFTEDHTLEEEEEEEEEKKNVQFEDLDDDEEDSENEHTKKLVVSDELTSLEFEDLDAPPTPPPAPEPPKEEKSLMDELTEKVGDTLVLNL